MEAKLYPQQNRDRILKLLSRRADILALPPVVCHVLGVTSEKNSGAGDLTFLIECDGFLSSAVLSAANSSYYGFAKKVSTVSHAVAMLGFQETQNIVLGCSVLKLFDTKGSDFAEKFWRHCFAAGVTARMLADYFRLKIEAKYFVAGLLHDIGKAFLSKFLPEKYIEMLAILQREDGKITYHALEERFFGITHAEVGARLLGSWRFPGGITDAVMRHHEPSRSQTDKTLAACVHIADLICTIKGFTSLGSRHFLTLEREILPFLKGLKENFGTEDLVSLSEQIDLEMERQDAFVSAFRV